MAKRQHCLMCGEVLYELGSFGEPADGVWPPLREDERYGTLLICPGCEAEHVTYLDRTVPDRPPIRRVRCLRPPD